MPDDDPRRVLETLIRERGESYAGLSRLLGRNAAYLQQFVKRGSPRRLPERERGDLARYFGVPESCLGGSPAPEPLQRVPVLDVAATAGAGGLLAQEDRRRYRRFDADLLRSIGVRDDAASIIRVIGDSMAPTLCDGDEILVDTAQRTVPDSGGLFVIRDGDGLRVKRLRPDGERMVVASDNPDFATQGVPRESLAVIGRVAWLGRVPG
ncbi:S24 family peptidase [Stakelama saccharophila]|uniref:S24 family peptidase n=1 Tax=Stakelama saccharophila TaxID=3075605 RepID=A0ABZ0B7C2_9SPHN|nr:S24 family peptidase [Stakelama sp. W311]WNO53294.1 S24 family peptidase [Stakelama sp. W311]